MNNNFIIRGSLMRKIFIFFNFIFYFTSTLIFAGETGKIVGQVLDKDNSEPLPGVNIFLQGTMIGASSDLEGEFFIINIPPGEYIVECSMIGYQTVILENVSVQSDQTTSLFFELSTKVLETADAIVVVAKRPLVQKDLTASKKVTTSKEIKALPVESFSAILSTQAGVTVGANGALHIRGGRSNEISYMVDGVSVANPYSGSGLGTTVSTNAIEEMTVVSGAFNAEYGNAMSGVVNLVTKDGTSKYSGNFTSYVGDYFSNDKDIFKNIDDIDFLNNQNFEGTLSGPLPNFLESKPTFFISAKYRKSEGYLYGVREHNPSDSANFNLKADTILVEVEDKIFTERIEFFDEWYIENTGDGAIVPMNPSESINLLGKMKFQLNESLILRLKSIYNNNKSKSYDHFYKYNPDGTNNFFSNSSHTSARIVHTLSPSTFYELRGAYNFRESKSYLYEDPYDPRYVPTDKIQGNPSGTTFAFGGTRNGHSYIKTHSYIGKFDISSQINKKHFVKAGIEAKIHRVNWEFFSVLYDRINYNEPTILGLDSPYHDKAERWPREASAYLQDKIEFDNMIMNVGLRYDYFFSNTDYIANLIQPDGDVKEATPKHTFSPRLGISFPITSRGIIHFSYGHFSQMPSYSTLYANPDFKLPKAGTTYFGYGNLRPQKTIMYEMGLQQQLTDAIAIDATVFYRDVRDYLTPQSIKFKDLDGEHRDYVVYQNQDYANIKGFTLALVHRISPSVPVSLKLDYTFQVAEGNDNNATAFYYNSLSDQVTVREILPLDWDQAHSLYGTITLKPIENASISFIGRLTSGLPYSPYLYRQNYDTTPNSERKPSSNSIDLLASYKFKFFKFDFTAFIKIYNLLDTRNEKYVFNDTGRANYTYAFRNQQETESLKNHYGESGVHTYDEYINRPDWYSSPRQIRLGFSFDF